MRTTFSTLAAAHLLVFLCSCTYYEISPGGNAGSGGVTASYQDGGGVPDTTVDASADSGHDGGVCHAGGCPEGAIPAGKCQPGDSTKECCEDDGTSFIACDRPAGILVQNTGCEITCGYLYAICAATSLTTYVCCNYVELDGGPGSAGPCDG